MKKTILSFAVAIMLTASAFAQTKETSANLLHEWNSTITIAMVSDGFHPKLASRSYTYPNIAAYEVLVNFHPEFRTLQKQLNELDSLPTLQKNLKYNEEIATIQAFAVVSKKVIYRQDMCDELLSKQIKMLQEKNGIKEDVLKNSIDFGNKVAERIIAWAKRDNYNKTKAMPKYIFSNEPGKWKPTPPEYRSACEPYWGILRPFALKNIDQYLRPSPVPFSSDTNSQFYKNVMEVYNISKKLTVEQGAIATFWDDNPDLATFKGHFMSPRRQMSPPAHWIGITTLACNLKNKNMIESAECYALVSVAMADGLILGWKEKYNSNLIRPITYIREYIDKDWDAFLVTPPFPEHSSGHSIASMAAATVLTKLVGDNVAYIDSSEVEYKQKPRAFTSFIQAAEEVSISRVYGGIHYMTGVNIGMEQGKLIGNYINTSIKTRK